MTFTDTSFSSDQNETVILITNPIDVQFSNQPNAMSAMKESNQIRVLVFRYFLTPFSFYLLLKKVGLNSAILQFKF